MRGIFESSFCVFICHGWSFPGPLIPSCSISTQLNVPTCQMLTLWDRSRPNLPSQSVSTWRVWSKNPTIYFLTNKPLSCYLYFLSTGTSANLIDDLAVNVLIQFHCCFISVNSHLNMNAQSEPKGQIFGIGSIPVSVCSQLAVSGLNNHIGVGFGVVQSTWGANLQSLNALTNLFYWHLLRWNRTNQTWNDDLQTGRGSLGPDIFYLNNSWPYPPEAKWWSRQLLMGSDAKYCMIWHVFKSSL